MERKYIVRAIWDDFFIIDSDHPFTNVRIIQYRQKILDVSFEKTCVKFIDLGPDSTGNPITLGDGILLISLDAPVESQVIII
jgi:hypothetical protein